MGVPQGPRACVFLHGTNASINFGLCIPVTGQITKATLSSTTTSGPSDEMKVNIVLNGSEVSHQVIKQTGNYCDTTVFQTH